MRSRAEARARSATRAPHVRFVRSAAAHGFLRRPLARDLPLHARRVPHLFGRAREGGAPSQLDTWAAHA